MLLDSLYNILIQEYKKESRVKALICSKKQNTSSILCRQGNNTNNYVILIFEK